MQNAIAAFALEYSNTGILYERKIISDLFICRTHQSVPDYSSPNIHLMSFALLSCLQARFIFQLLSIYSSKWIHNCEKRSLNWAIHPFKLRMRASPKAAIKLKPNKTNKNYQLLPDVRKRLLQIAKYKKTKTSTPCHQRFKLRSFKTWNSIQVKVSSKPL